MVMFITTFTVKGEPEQFEKVFAEHAEFMARQPGFVGYRFLRAAGEPNVYVNIGEWDSPEAQRQVTESPQFRAHAGAMRALVDVRAGVYLPVAQAGDIR